VHALIPRVPAVLGALTVGVTVVCACSSVRDAGGTQDAAPPRVDSGLGPQGEGVVGVGEAGQSAPEASAPRPVLQASDFGPVELVASGFLLAEGPLWDPCHGVLLFTDVDTATIHRLTPPSEVDTYRSRSNYANGLAFDREGRIVAAEMGTFGGQIGRYDGDQHSTLVDRSPKGGRLNTTDDLVFRSDGLLYFTDPVFPHGPILSVDLLRALPVYSFDPRSMRLRVEAEVRGPNGIVLSPDEQTLYVASYFEGRVLRFRVAADGSVSELAPLIEGLAQPDSMCVDVEGNLYVGVRDGLLVVTPEGTPLTLIDVPSSRGVTNCEFGGENGTTLYITAWSALYQVVGAPRVGLDWQNHRAMKCR